MFELDNLTAVSHPKDVGTKRANGERKLGLSEK
jgi:hypothetical protein